MSKRAINTFTAGLMVMMGAMIVLGVEMFLGGPELGKPGMEYQPIFGPVMGLVGGVTLFIGMGISWLDGPPER